MFSLSQFRTNLFPIFNLIKDNAVVLEVVYNKTVYEFSITKTNKKPDLRRPKRVKKQTPVFSMPATICEECNELMISGICMNTKCPSNS